MTKAEAARSKKIRLFTTGTEGKRLFPRAFGGSPFLWTQLLASRTVNSPNKTMLSQEDTTQESMVSGHYRMEAY